MPLVSVVVPTYNRCEQLPRAIDSILKQTAQDLEVIVVDDGSSDDTPAVAKRFTDPRVRYLRRENGGVCAARNTGIAAARGDWLAFLDDDDEWLPEKLSLQLAAAERAGTDVGLVGCVLLRRFEDLVSTVRWPADASGEVQAEPLLNSVCAFMQTALIRSSALNDVGHFDEAIGVCEDYELAIRLQQRWRLITLSEPLVVSYESLTGLANNTRKRRDSLRVILQRHSALLEQHRIARANIHREIGKAALKIGDRTGGFSSMLASIKAAPLDPRAYGYLLLGPFGADGYAVARGAYRYVKKMLGGYR